MPYQSFEELEVWQRGCRLAVDIFKAFADCKESKEISSMLEGLRKSIPRRHEAPHFKLTNLNLKT